MTGAKPLTDDFLAVLSHEIRTPLTGIMLWLDILRSDPEVAGTAAAAEALPIISESAELLLRIVEDLRDLSQLGAAKLPLDRRPADLGALVGGTIDRLRHRIEEEAGLVLVAEIEQDLPHALVDAARIERVVGNLLANAARRTEAPGQVTVRVRRAEAGNALILEVADTRVAAAPEALSPGPGRSEHRDATPFGTWRVPDVGLALAHALVEAHGGRISAGAGGGGNTFAVRLPIAEAGRAAPAGSNPAAAADPGVGRADPRPTVVLAEDTRATRQALAAILTANGYRVLAVADGAEAIQAARTGSPAAILLDIGMPNVDGLSALERLRADPLTAGIPVAALTARATSDEQQEIVAAGFDGYLVKPFRAPDLVATLERLVKRQASPSRRPPGSR